MFGRLFGARLRAAEKAARDGRLDEAFRLATMPDLQNDARCKALLNEITGKFIQRAKEHLAAERFEEAMADLACAEAGGGPAERIAELRTNVRLVAGEVDRLERSRRRRLEDARKRMAAGSLAGGRDALAEAADSDAEAKALAKEIAEREARAAERFAEVDRLIKAKQFDAALTKFKNSRNLCPNSADALRIEQALCSEAADRARRLLMEGKINRAGDEIARLGDVGAERSERRDVDELVRLAEAASGAVDRGEYEEARRQVLRLQGLGLNAAWVKRCAHDLEQLDTLLTAIHAGPLGESAATTQRKEAKRIVGGAVGRGQTAATPVQRTRAELEETVVLPGRSPVAGGRRGGSLDSGLPDRLLVLVDGGGSYLFLRHERVSIGRAMSRDPADIPIRSDLSERQVEITRVDDDYFLFSSKGLDVDGRTTKHHLLRDGNRITLARNARFTFRKPLRRSASARLDMSSSTHLPNDVRRVVLFHQTATIGFGSNVHVSCNGAVHPLILFERNGALWIRPQGNGRIDTEARMVRLGEPVEVMNVSFVVQPWATSRHERLET